MDVSVRAFPILSIIHSLAQFHGKRYCYPSQETFKEFLKTRLQVYMSIATLNRWLRLLEDAGYLKRQRRIRKAGSRGMIFQSTMYFLTQRGCKFLARCGVAVWGKLKGISTVLKKQASFGPKKKKPAPESEEVDYLTGTEISERLKEYLNSKPS